jgi:hypothetical protein
MDSYRNVTKVQVLDEDDDVLKFLARSKMKSVSLKESRGPLTKQEISDWSSTLTYILVKEKIFANEVQTAFIAAYIEKLNEDISIVNTMDVNHTKHFEQDVLGFPAKVYGLLGLDQNSPGYYRIRDKINESKVGKKHEEYLGQKMMELISKKADLEQKSDDKTESKWDFQDYITTRKEDKCELKIREYTNLKNNEISIIIDPKASGLRIVYNDSLNSNIDKISQSCKEIGVPASGPGAIYLQSDNYKQLTDLIGCIDSVTPIGSSSKKEILAYVDKAYKETQKTDMKKSSESEVATLRSQVEDLKAMVLASALVVGALLEKINQKGVPDSDVEDSKNKEAPRPPSLFKRW